MASKTISVVSLGCFRNSYDSDIVIKRFLDQGYVLNNDCDRCDLLVINTCGFITAAKKESLQEITRAIGLKRKKMVREILVFGCLVQRYKDELKKFYPEVDHWRGVEDFTAAALSPSRLMPAHLAFLKICEGCLNRCSYCAIPAIKGPLVSKPAKKIIDEAIFLEQRGVRELTLIGQDITSWGKDLDRKCNLAGLLKMILKKTSIKWIRLIYAHPLHFSYELIDVIAANGRICRYIDLPIQHINDRILMLMNRGISRRGIEVLIKRIRDRIPGCFIRTSIIVGFPQETEAEFEELLDFVKNVKFERLGAFIYSREEGTPAYSLPRQVHWQTRRHRFNRLMAAQKAISSLCAAKLVGKKVDVLIDSKEGGVFVGRTQYDAYDVDGQVFVNSENAKIGQFYKANIVDAYEYDLVGV